MQYAPVVLNILKHAGRSPGSSWFITDNPDLLRCLHGSIPGLTRCPPDHHPGQTGAQNRDSAN